ncbi:hypothetical protein [Petrocella sp. FN5]|uniref:hypothetical protein n=1 Tax=Petrocella sp. FN5 TaxID=3032002 RepID=UPI0023DAD61B|nr:hypothetical protein [Petrocella sp. FN5]MDF1618016.1 hypothetical protein [Petrocella sp. FN5]
MDYELWMFIGVMLMIMAFGLMFIAKVIDKRLKKRQLHLKVKQNQEQVNRYYLRMYKLLSGFCFTRHKIANIRLRIEMIGHTNERVIRKKTVKIYLTIMVLMVFLMAGMIIITRQPILLMLLFLAIWLLSETVIDFLVERLKNRLLYQQLKFNDMVRHKYYETHMIDEAVYDACQELGEDHYEICIQGERIHDVLRAKDVEKEILAYNETAPNKFLKMFLGLAYITMEYGDTKVDGHSVFLKNIGDLTGEIRIELSKREKLNYALKSLNVIVFLPLFFINPVKRWASGYFMPMKVFYDSRAGFFLEMFIIMMVLLAYFLLRKIQQFDDQKTVVNKKKVLEKTLYEKGLYQIVDFIKPAYHKGHYYRLKLKLKNSASHLDVEAFITRKCLYFFTGCMVALMVIIALQMNTKKMILTAPTIPDYFLGGQLSETALKEAEAITKKDRSYLHKMNRNMELEDVIHVLEESGIPVSESERMAQRIMKKHRVFIDQYIKWWEVLLILIIGILSYNIPEIMLIFQRRILRFDVEDEVMGFSTILLMLMNHERLSLMDVLEWMALYAYTFKAPIQDCINNTSSGMVDALKNLRDTSDDSRFIRLVDSLILAAQDITIKQAFDELESEKSHYLEERKTTNDQVVEKKVNLGKIIGFAPVYGFILLYMIYPMIISSMADMESYLNRMMQL